MKKIFVLFTLLFFFNIGYSQNRLTYETLQSVENTILANPQKVIDKLSPYEKQVKRGKIVDSVAAWYYHILGDAYYYAQRPKKAIKYYDKELDFIKKHSDARKLVRTYYNLGTIAFNMKNYWKAENYYKKALTYAKKVKDNYLFLQIYKALAQTYKKQAQYKNAYNAFVKYSYYKDRVYKITSTEKLALLKEKYTQVKKEKQVKEVELSKKKKELSKTKEKLTETEAINKLLEKDAQLKKEQIKRLNLEKELKEKIIKLKEAETLRKNEKIKEQQRVILLISILVGVVLVFSLFVLFLLIRLKKTNRILQQQKEEIERNYKIIQQQNKKITDSINYAKQIQHALLPWPNTIAKHFSEHFVFFKPKDIVSGDFYWLTAKQGYTYVVVSDCTGHGVPGAFMSMLGIAFLSDIVNGASTPLEPKDILEKLREYIMLALKDKDDGMDMVLLRFDKNKKEILYAGANNPVFVATKNDIVEYKPTRAPIGRYIKNIPFKQEQIIANSGDIIYMFSDGFVDQFGGEKGSKFMKKNFKKLLFSISHLSMEEQKNKIETVFYEWTHTNNKEYQQTDDVLVMGIKI